VTDYFHARDALEPVSRDDLVARLRDDLVTVLDVRPEDEFTLGHLPGALNIPHAKSGILAPTMTGDATLERTIRAHTNTLEWMPIFLPSMWLLAIYWSPFWAAILGGVWIVGRIVYFVGYRAAAEKRFPGFFIQTSAAFALLLGALGRIIYLIASST
jgi:glutathione S-transferase